MAAGRAVVATNAGGASEAVSEGETGYLVNTGDDLAMAERLIGLLRDCEKKRTMGDKGRVVVEQKFSCQNRLAKTIDLYRRFLN
jgi:glycosyltransferase involved in cell wall biosynthesis